MCAVRLPDGSHGNCDDHIGREKETKKKNKRRHKGREGNIGSIAGANCKTERAYKLMFLSNALDEIPPIDHRRQQVNSVRCLSDPVLKD